MWAMSHTLISLLNCDTLCICPFHTYRLVRNIGRFHGFFLKTVLIFYMPGKLACKISKSLKKQGKRQISFGPTYRYTCICWFLFEHYQNTILVKFNIINSQCKLLLQIIGRGCFKASKLNWRPNEKLLYESFCIFRPFCPLIAL